MSHSQRLTTQAVRIAIGVAAGAVIVLGLALLLSIDRYGSVTPDGVTYVAATDRWLDGEAVYTPMQQTPYALTEASWGKGFVYPPTALPAVALFGVVGAEAWRVLNLAVLLVVALLIVRLERKGLSITAALVTSAYVVINPFVWSAWANAQITPLLVALMGVGYVYPRAAGLLGAVGALVKVYPGAMLVWAYRENGWKGVLGGLLAGALLVAATWPFVGHEWVNFLAAASNAYPSCDVGWPDSIQCMVGESYGTLAALAIGGGCVLLALFIRQRSVAFAFLMFGAMLASPDLNWAYWILPSIGLLPALARLIPARQPPTIIDVDRNAEPMAAATGRGR